MDRERLFTIIALLDLPEGEWVVFGGACLTAHGIRTTSDLELFVTHVLYKKLRNDGWQEKVANSTGAAYITKPYLNIPVLAFMTCGSIQWRPAVKSYLRNPEVLDGWPFMPLSEMYKWKEATARPKDIADLQLINDYLETSS